MAMSRLLSGRMKVRTEPFYTASTPTITYKDETGQFREGSSFGRHDLLDLAEAAREAALKIRDLGKNRVEGQAR